MTAQRRSAGLLLWRSRSRGLGGVGRIEVLLGHPGGPFFARKDEGSWTIPKGEVEPGEDELAAAHREFSEELGTPVPTGEARPLGELKQSSSKVNVIWALEVTAAERGAFWTQPGPLEVSSNLFDLEWPPRSGRTAQFPEVDRTDWFSLPDAAGKLFVSQRAFLDRLAALLSCG